MIDNEQLSKLDHVQAYRAGILDGLKLSMALVYQRGESSVGSYGLQKLLEKMEQQYKGLKKDYGLEFLR